MTMVLHVTEKLERHGGTPRKLLYLMQHADRTSLRHSFVTFVPGNLDAEMRAAGANVLCAGSPNVTAVTRSVFKAATRERASVICTHFTRSLVCGVAVGRLLRLPVIHNVHTPVPPMPRENLIGRVGRMASRWSYPATTLVTANSRFTAMTLQKVFGIPDDKMRVLPNPVVSREATARGPDADVPERGPATLRLVQIGGLIALRRQHLLLEALAIIVRNGVDADLLMVGDGPLKGALVELSRGLGIAERVHWLGFRDDVGEVLAAADLYVSAIDTEGFGIAVVEAMLHGIPVVLANGGAYPELVDDGRNGVLFDPQDPRDLAKQVVDLWLDAPRRVQLAEAARRHAAQTYTPQNYTERFAGVIAEVLRA